LVGGPCGSRGLGIDLADGELLENWSVRSDAEPSSPFRVARDFALGLRSCESAEAKRLYMINNPVRAGLVTQSEEWPFQGEIFKSESWW
jgi:hypothetical protein